MAATYVEWQVVAVEPGQETEYLVSLFETESQQRYGLCDAEVSTVPLDAGGPAVRILISPRAQLDDPAAIVFLAARAISQWLHPEPPGSPLSDELDDYGPF